MVLNIISMLTGLISIGIGCYAIWQAARYNKESKITNQDTSKLLESVLILVQNTQKVIVRERLSNSAKINMAKDEFIIIKLNTFDGNNISKAMELISKLRIKKHTSDFIEEFLKDKTKSEIKCNFYCFAETRDAEGIEIILKELINYGLLIVVDYQASKNT